MNANWRHKTDISIMNINVLDFIQICLQDASDCTDFSLDFQNFPGEHAPGHPSKFPFSMSNSRLWLYQILWSFSQVMGLHGCFDRFIVGWLLHSVCMMVLLLFVGCLTSQQHASVSQGQIYSDSFMCCHTEIEVADPTFHLTQSQYTDTGANQSHHWPYNGRRLAGWPLECQFLSHLTPEKSWNKWDSNLGSSALEAEALTTRPMRQSSLCEPLAKGTQEQIKPVNMK